MPRTIWTKLQSNPNGTWTQHQGEPPFSIPVTGGLVYDIFTDTGESFTITPLIPDVAPDISGQPVISGQPAAGQTLVATAAPSSGTAPIATSWQWLRNGVEIAGATSDSFALTTADEGSDISVRQTDSNTAGSDSAVSASVSVATVGGGNAAVITGLVVTDQTVTGEVALAYSIDRDSSITGILTRSAASPSATRVLAGQDETGAPAASSFTDVWTMAGNDTLPVIASGLAADTYYLHVLPQDGGDADVVSSNGFWLETVLPEIVLAQSSTSGLKIELDFSEGLTGATAATDWTLTADGELQEIALAVITGNRVTLTVSAPLLAGQDLVLSYSGSTLTDLVANPVAVFSGLAVENIVTGVFLENSVRVPRGSSLTSRDPLPGNARALLFFSSLTQDPSLDSRAALATWNGTSGGFHSDYTSGNTACGVRIRLQAGATTITQGSEPVLLGTRYLQLISAWIDTSDMMNVRTWVLDTSAGDWMESMNISTAAAPNGVFNLGPDPLRLFVRSDGSNQAFDGRFNRIAFWAGPQSTPIANVTDPAVRDLFGNATGLADPALSRVSFGQPLVDFYGSAAECNAGLHSGSLNSFVSTGTFL